MPELHESQKASGRQQPEPGLVESVVEEEGEAEAVQSAGGVGGMRTGALKGWWQRLGAAAPAETPLSSESGAAASGRWTRARGEEEEEGEEG